MDDGKRFVEHGELDKLIYGLIDDEHSGTISNTEALDRLLSALLSGITSSMVDRGLLHKDTKSPESFTKLNQLATEFPAPEERHLRVLTTLAIGRCFEDAIKNRNLALSVLYAIKLAEDLTHKPPAHSNNPVTWSDFDPLTGRYPEVENMYPSSIAGQLVSVIKSSREIWRVEDGLEDWKLDQAKRLKDIYMHVTQYADRYGNEWADELHQTSENPMVKLEGQIDSKLIMHFTTRARSLYGEHDSRITTAEVLALYAILNAFNGLHSLELDEISDTDENHEWARQYMSEAFAFLKSALSHRITEEQPKLISEHFTQTRRERDKWTLSVRAWLKDNSEELQDKNNGTASRLAIKLTEDAKRRRFAADGTQWNTDSQAKKWLESEIGKLRNNKAPYNK